MLPWIVLFAATVLMYRIAEVSYGKGSIWGPTTFVICLVCGLTIPLPLINVVIGLIVSYVAMVLICARRK